MARRKKRTMYEPLVMVGTFLESTYLDVLAHDGEYEGEGLEKSQQIEFISKSLRSAAVSSAPDYAKTIEVFDADSIHENDAEDVYDSPGFYIGVQLGRVPEHFSVKRIKIDIRTILVASKLIPEDSDPDDVTLFAKVVKYEE